MPSIFCDEGQMFELGNSIFIHKERNKYIYVGLYIYELAREQPINEFL
jgi:hypothetical protein